MSDERWLTVAVDDNEAAKCKMLALSLKHSLTTRLTQILVLPNVSEKAMCEMQKEFDICTRIPKADENKRLTKIQVIEEHFSKCELSHRKIAYLDCNFLLLENSDKVFSLNRNKNLGFLNLLEENADAVYCFSLDFTKEICLNGKQIKMVHFDGKHPLELSSQEITEFSAKSPFANNILIWSKFLQENVELEKRMGMNRMVTNNAVAIIGMACKFAGSNNTKELWSMLAEGVDVIAPVPKGRWCSQQETKSYFLKEKVDTFDHKFFSVHVKEAPYIDPQHRLAMQLVWETLENSGTDPLSLKSKSVGVFGGLSNNDYKSILQELGVGEENYLKMYMGNTLGNLTARISHFLQVNGPCVATDSGCSSSMVAVHLGATSIQQGECELAIIVGVNLLLYPFSPDTLTTLLAPDGKCKAFDVAGDGFGRGEGVAAIILKKLSHALSDGDNILGVIRGSAVVQEGESESMGTPTVIGEALAMQMALDRAGVLGKEVSYLESHGTGTSVGDPIEISAIAKAYSQDRTDKLIIGSLKTNVGHTESVSGLAGIIKTLLCLKNEMIPTNLHFNVVNPELNLDAIPALIASTKEGIPWKGEGVTPRIAGISSFGITGTAAHIILQEPPTNEMLIDQKLEKFPEHIFTISGNSFQSLKLQVKAYSAFLKTTRHPLDEIEYTMHTGRAHLSHRLFLIANKHSDLSHQLEQFEKQPSVPIKRSSTEEVKICFLFTGQGSQYLGMGQDLYQNSFVFRSNMDHCLSILDQKYGIKDLKTVVFGNDQDALSRPLYSALAIFCLEYALFRVWNSWGVFPSSVLGHSLGEFGAAVAAGMLTLNDALKLIVHRSELVEQESMPGRMIAVDGNEEFVEKHLKLLAEDSLSIAALNAENQTVVSGNMAQVEATKRYFKDFGIKAKVLCARHGFHSQLMDNILNKFSITTKSIEYYKSTIPYISSVQGSRLHEMNSDYWLKHLRNKVNFLSAIRSIEDPDTIFLEIGPTALLSALITSSSPVDRICLPSLRKGSKNEFCPMLQALGTLYSFGLNVNWSGFHRYSGHKRKVALPNYQFHLESYWLGESQDNKKHHPLLGTQSSTAAPAIVFWNQLSLTKALEFLREKKTPNLPLLSPAIFLEMTLMAALQASEIPLKNDAVQKISNIVFHTPVKLSEGKSLKMQTVVDQQKENSDSFEVRIFSKFELDWVMHTSADFQVEPNEINCSLELFSIQVSLAGNKENKFPEISELLPIKIISFHKGIDEMLLEIHLPLTITADEYVVQPALLYIMIQVVGILHEEQFLSKDNKVVTLIKQIKNVLVIPQTNVSNKERFYVYGKRNVLNNYYDACIFDEIGNVVVILENVEFFSSPEKQITIELQPTPMFVEVWEDQVSLSIMESIPQTAGSCFIVFTGNDPLSQKLLETLKQKNFKIAEIQLVTELDNNNENQVLCNDQSALDAKLNVIFNENSNVQGMLYMWGLSCTLNCEEMLQPAFYLCKYLAKQEEFSFGVVVCTKGLFACKPDKIPMKVPVLAPLVGVFKTFWNENYRFHCKVVDFDAHCDDTTLQIEQVVAEMLLHDGEFSIAYRNAVRMVQRLKKLPRKHLILGRKSLFKEESTYLVTGGMTGIGEMVGRWLIQCGVKFLVLVNRSTVMSHEQIEALGKNAKIALKHLDIGSLEDCKNLLKELQQEGFPPLKGVFHAAGIIRDHRIENMEWSTYPAVLRGKLWGAWNLHQLTINMDLDHFVMFSSLAAIVGSNGQSNYTAANYFLDYLTHYRRSLGLEATSINWGQWGEVGMAAKMNLPAITPFSVKQGIAAMEQILLRKMPQVSVAQANFTLLQSGCITMNKYADDIIDAEEETESQREDTEKRNFSFWAEYDAGKSQVERQQKITALIMCFLSYSLKVEEDEVGSGNFKKLGMDSLMTIEMLNFLQRTLRSRAKISHTQLRGCGTVQLLAVRIVGLIPIHLNITEKNVPSLNICK